MPDFIPSSVHKATVTFSNPKSAGFDYEASLCMGVDWIEMAVASFHLDAGQSKAVVFSVTMPGNPGTYPVYFKVTSGGKVIGIFAATEIVVLGGVEMSMEEAQGTGGDFYMSVQTLGCRVFRIAASALQDIATITPTFAVTSGVFAAFIMYVMANAANALKARLYINGVLIAESEYIAASPKWNWLTVKGTAVLSGVNIVKGSIYNYSDGEVAAIIGTMGNVDSSPYNTQLSEIVVGSIKV